jgi:DNA replication protein DnaC
MNTANTVDTARLNLLLNELRLPAIKVLWPQFAEQSDKEGWPAARFLATITEHEIAERGRRRIERHLVEARLPVGKTFDNFDFEAVPMISKAQVTALAAGDGWLGKGANLLLFGPPESDSYCPSRYPLRVEVLFDPDRQTMAAGTAAHARRA